MDLHLASTAARALMIAATLSLLPFPATAADSPAGQGAEFQQMIVLPTDVRQIAYPIDYQVAQPRTATVADPYCATASETVAFPADWVGVFALPEATGGPLPSSVRRGASVKDYWDFGRNNPSTNQGCGGSIRQAFEVTLDRFGRLGVQHVNISQYFFFADGARPERGLRRAQHDRRRPALHRRSRRSAGHEGAPADGHRRQSFRFAPSQSRLGRLGHAIPRRLCRASGAAGAHRRRRRVRGDPARLLLSRPLRRLGAAPRAVPRGR